MGNLEDKKNILMEIDAEIGKIKVHRAVSIIASAAFSLGTLALANTNIKCYDGFSTQEALISLGSTFAVGFLAIYQGFRAYCENETIKDLKIERRSLNLEINNLERLQNVDEPKIFGLRRIK